MADAASASSRSRFSRFSPGVTLPPNGCARARRRRVALDRVRRAARRPDRRSRRRCWRPRRRRWRAARTGSRADPVERRGVSAGAGGDRRSAAGVVDARTRAALERPAVAIVGSRAASPYALAVAERLAADLAAHGIAIVSGLARGVDSAAHRGALAAGGVDGRGARVRRRCRVSAGARGAGAGDRADGAVVSELVPGTPPRPQFFPQRNRIISGLSRAVVVDRGGREERIADHGALRARTGPRRAGRAGQRAERTQPRRARAAEGRGKIVESGGRYPGGTGRRGQTGGRPAPARSASVAATDPMLACLTPGEPCDLDEISERSGLTLGALLPRLFELELAGRHGARRRRTFRPV